MNRNKINVPFGAGAVGLCVLASLAGAAPSFQAGTSLATAQRPSAAAVGDFNNDGRPDVGVTVDTPDRILLFIGTGNGAFAAPQTISLPGSGARDLFATDVDGDGDQDFVVAMHNSNLVRVMLNNGSASFTQGGTAPVGSDARGGVMAQIGGDARMDFAFANRDSNSVSVVINNGGTLAGTSFAVGNDPRAVGAGDLDDDNDGDIVVSNHDDRTIGVYRNNAGAFALVTNLSVPNSTRPSGMAIADVTGDGLKDIIATADDDDTGRNLVLIYRRTGNMTFAAPQQLNTGGSNPSHVVAGDLDGDGDLDIVAANEDSGNVSIFDNQGNGAWGAAQIFATGANPERVTIADVNGGGVDILVPNRDSNTTSLLLNQNNTGPTTCEADLSNPSGTATPDGGVDINDLLFFLARFEQGTAAADLDNGTGTGTSDGAVTVDDLLFMVVHFEAGC